jgi:hypothetical protein
MKKLLLSSFLLSLFFNTELFSQENTIRCFTTEKHQEALSENPEILSIQEQLEYFTENFIQNENATGRAVITIPVVVHVVYRLESQNTAMTNARIQNQINILNQDFNGTNADTNLTPAPFKPLRGNAEINFCLAQRDPQGFSTTGITRTQTTVSNIGNTNNYFKTANGGIDIWDRTKYLNIWVCEIGGGILGFAYLPGTASSDRDGVVIDLKYFGTPGATSPYNKGRTATHEVGHWLNLRHIWGDNTCGNDFVTDTPTQQSDNGSCPTFPHRANSCSTTNPDGDMFSNYMDYTNDACMNIFTAGQITRMRSALNATAGGRNQLQNSQGCVPGTPNFIQENMLFTRVKSYPNPANQNLTIEFPMDVEHFNQISVLDLLGNEVLKINGNKIQQHQYTIPLEELSNGTYLIIVNTNQGILTDKFIVAK